MKSLNELHKELSEVKERLNQISIKTGHSTAWAPGVQDQSKSESFTVTEYTDEYLARQLQEKITYLNDQITNYATYAEEERKMIETQKRMEAAAHEKYVDEKARGLYEAAQQEYHKKSLLGKVTALFKGKKPKKNMTEEEIQAKYRPEAAYQVERDTILAKIAELEKERDQSIAFTKSHPGENTQALIDYYNYEYEQGVATLRNQLNDIEKQKGL